MYRYAAYFENDVLAKRPYIKKAWCEQVVAARAYVVRQDDGRYRFWGRISAFENRFLRVVTLEDQETILNAFFDRNFKESA